MFGVSCFVDLQFPECYGDLALAVLGLPSCFVSDFVVGFLRRGRLFLLGCSALGGITERISGKLICLEEGTIGLINGNSGTCASYRWYVLVSSVSSTSQRYLSNGHKAYAAWLGWRKFKSGNFKLDKLRAIGRGGCFPMGSLR